MVLEVQAHGCDSTTRDCVVTQTTNIIPGNKKRKELRLHNLPQEHTPSGQRPPSYSLSPAPVFNPQALGVMVSI